MTRWPGSVCRRTRDPLARATTSRPRQVAADALLEHGFLYYCDCTPAEIEARKAPGSPPGYDGFCRDRGLARSATTALRFRTPREGVTVVHDIIRGDVEFANNLIDDFVVVRSSGRVLYALANVDRRPQRPRHPRRSRRGASRQRAQADHALGGAERVDR